LSRLLSIAFHGKPASVMRPEPSSSDLPSGQNIRDRRLMQEATTWFMRQGASDYSVQEQLQFEAWKRRSPAHASAYEHVRALWNSADLDRAIERVVASSEVVLDQRPARSRRRWIGTAVAAALLLVSMALWSGELLIRLKADYRTGTGEQRVVTLPDQSIVTLNTDTTISLQYLPNRRVIHLLQGEAAFTVRSNAARPFTVESGGVATTAVGTEFLVRARREDVQVTVLSGAVQVTDRKMPSTEAVRLAAGDQVSVGPDGARPIIHVDTAAKAAWMQGRLIFVRTPLAEVVQELTRYHPGYAVVWNPALQTLPVTGIYNLSNPSHIFTTLADTLPIHMVRLTDHMIVIR
jgi:transmembrane sensor